MSSARIIQIIKSQLKSQGVNYKSLAVSLNLSESAVKRMLASGNMSLKRLDEICDVLGLDFAELLRLLDQTQERLQGLSEADEERLVGDPRLLLVAYCVVNGWEAEHILKRYRLTEIEIIPLLAELDRMKLIELLPGNRIRRLLGNNFRWKSNGPIERFFRSQVQQEFLGSTFSGQNDLHLVKNADITPAAMSRLAERISMIGRLFDDLTRDERHIPQNERRGTTMVLAIRHWQYRAFRDFER
ncbi:MAG: helix-turn-helix transcriptional regulator [Pseudomonadota bacterium]